MEGFYKPNFAHDANRTKRLYKAVMFALFARGRTTNHCVISPELHLPISASANKPKSNVLNIYGSSLFGKIVDCMNSIKCRLKFDLHEFVCGIFGLVLHGTDLI